jgi:iron complex outermembrane recepter protein
VTRSRKRKLRRSLGLAAGVAAGAVGIAGTGYAEESVQSGGLEEIVVTAQKRTESLQNVPLSITALGTATLEEQHVASFDDYAKLLPSVAYSTVGPGFARVYMRGVVAGDNGNHSGSLPSVGVYLDEQPITTIQGPLDLHIYDIARVEALAGPQGTLYGASSQAGTIRIITNKPDLKGFKAGYDLQGSTLSHGDPGYTAEGFVNLPINDKAAVRLVGWVEHDGGFIDNVPGTRTYPVSGITINNASVAKKHYNDTDVYGGRAALRIELNDSWTITPTVMAQQENTHGLFAYDPNVGPLQVTHFYPEDSRDAWWQAALTVEGKISNFDLVYAGALLKRNDVLHQDYTDYSYFYDVCCQYGAYITDSSGALINPSQFITGKDHYKKQSHELRITSPQDWRLRFVAGVFLQRQEHGIFQDYQIKNFDPGLSVTGYPGTIWLTEQRRIDRDYAAFGELTYDLTERLKATAGIRFFEAKNSLVGFYGLSGNFSSSTGEVTCELPRVPFNGAPCVNLDRTVDEHGNTPKLNLTYQIDERHMVYATWSKGFRPGGVNRRGNFPPYKADFLKNYEIGWKTSWAENRVRFNGAVFREDWTDFQFSFLGANGLTNVTNAGGARIMGLESELEWLAAPSLTLTAGFSLLDPKLTEDFCKQLDANGIPLTNCPSYAFAPKDTQLPVTPKFKGNLTARYSFGIADWDAHLQGSFVYQGASRSELIPTEEKVVGPQGAYGLADFTFGVEKNKLSLELFVENAFDKHAVLSRYAECSILYTPTGDPLCGQQAYVVTNRPRAVGLKFGQKF